jgi:hypothetical protein
MNNEKKESFHRLSQARLAKVKDALDVLGNCSNKSAYEYTEEEVVKIFNEIEEKVRHTKTEFKFEKAVFVPGEVNTKTWKELASNLKSHGSLKNEFSRTQWGQNCVKFYVRDSVFWFTCYALHFKDVNKRKYGIFISFPEKFQEESSSINQRAYLSSLQSRLIENKDKINIFLPEISLFSGVYPNSDTLAGWQRELSEFSSDEEALKWLEETLNTFTDVFVPLINQVK